ncbi:uncharacterized protein LOC108248131 isoform X2 [Kryptolebias marmoratus]|uniref:uncharacterized protein LOC108248131 isoform X2 n=1 Tax=Kryptolebias marmoratus TaxID=37003 RepID=UPI0007F925F9|nr:uncharacterized protein LOC108248131 isoform X2 [Kryptolebias marmoratus]
MLQWEEVEGRRADSPVSMRSKWESNSQQPEHWNSLLHEQTLSTIGTEGRFNSGISLLSFTEHNLDDPVNTNVSCSDLLKAELHLLPNAATMNTFTHQKRPLMRSCSLGDTTSRTTTLQTLTPSADQCRERKKISRQRRLTVASYIPQYMDQNGNITEKDVNGQEAKPLCELNTEGVCQWFTRIGLQKCLPFIREAKLCGGDIASVDANILDVLHVVTVEDREQLLSTIYNELHPPSSVAQTLDSLLESNSVETFTSTLSSMTQSKSSPYVSCLSMNRRSFKLRNGSQNQAASRSSQMIEITVNASERIVHLRTPKETTMGKVMDSCIKMLGMTDDQSLFTLKEKQDSPDELCPDQQIGSMLTSENKQLELYMCKTDKQNSPESSGSSEQSNTDRNVQEDQAAKEDRIRELNQQVDSLQNVVLQIQELHHSLVAFCSDLKNMDTDVDADGLGSAALKQKLEAVNVRLNEKRRNLQILRGNINNATAHKNKQLEVRLLEKININCQVFQEEISIVHLNRQAAHLQHALQKSCTEEEAETQPLAAGSLSRLVSPESPAMLMVIQDNQNPDGHFGFVCHLRDDGGLVVVEVNNSHLLVEVNGVPVVNATLKQLNDLLRRGPCAQIVVLRRLPPTLASPSLLQAGVSSGPGQTPSSRRDVVATETPPQRKVMAI